METIFYPEVVPLYALIDVFFLYSFLGWAMECVVIRREKGVWENRGFARSPFCIIYGFGAMLGYAVLRPLAGNFLLLFFVGALTATAFEYLTARAMMRLFGEFWWDYSAKRFNYKGILCLESTVAWGLLMLLLTGFLHRFLVRLVLRMPPRAGWAMALVLSGTYLVDFTLRFRSARRRQPPERPA